jgi:hypothetical protein
MFYKHQSLNQFFLLSFLLALFIVLPAPGQYAILTPSSGDIIYAGDTAVITIVSTLSTKVWFNLSWDNGRQTSALPKLPQYTNDIILHDTTKVKFVMPSQIIKVRWDNDLNNFVSDTLNLMDDSCWIMMFPYGSTTSELAQSGTFFIGRKTDPVINAMHSAPTTASNTTMLQIRAAFTINKNGREYGINGKTQVRPNRPKAVQTIRY